MEHFLRVLVALVGFGPFVASLGFLWLAQRRGSDVPLGERLWNVVGGLLWGVGFGLVFLCTGDTAQVVGLVLLLASLAQSVIWNNRLQRRGRDKRAV